MKRPHRSHTAAFKAKVANKGDKTVAALAERFDVHPNQIMQLLESASGVFAMATEKQASTPDLKDLYAKVGQQVAGMTQSIWARLESGRACTLVNILKAFRFEPWQ